ncbi:MAG TPA: hypothetical protein VLD19_10340, partial [Chitinophagaceae bacterium]|nr:hypothetical protein [Chitinophagaceae bacterium]
MNKQPVDQAGHFEQHHLMLKPFDIEGLTESMIARYSPSGAYPDLKAYQHIFPAGLEINRGSFSQYGKIPFPTVSLVLEGDELLLECTCPNRQGTLCEHQALVLTALIKRDELGVFFNTKLRHEKLRKFAADYGLQNEANPDDFFQITYQDKKLLIIPRLPSLIPVTKDSLSAMGELLLPAAPPPATDSAGQVFCVVLRQHKYYKHLQIELYSAPVTKEGKIKNPLTAVNPLEAVWEPYNQQYLKFFAGLNKFQQHASAKKSEADIAALRAVAENPAGYDFYYHDSSLSENITATSIIPVKINTLPNDISLSITPKEQFYQLDCQLTLNGRLLSLQDLSLRFSYFILAGDTLYLVDRLAVLGVFELLKKKSGHLLVHASK